MSTTEPPQAPAPLPSDERCDAHYFDVGCAKKIGHRGRHSDGGTEDILTWRTPPTRHRDGK